MANINDEPEHLFDQVVRIGYGIEICKYLWRHELAALACVDRQCAEAVRWQREKGNIKSFRAYKAVRKYLMKMYHEINRY
jgi:hypothetical protein